MYRPNKSTSLVPEMANPSFSHFSLRVTLSTYNAYVLLHTIKHKIKMLQRQHRVESCIAYEKTLKYWKNNGKQDQQL